MKYIPYLVITFTAFFLVKFAFADELVVIQNVSSSRKTLVINKGAIDGVTYGQEAVFVSPKISISLNAIEINRHYSLWQVADPEAAIPFDIKEIVIYTTSPEALWAGNSYLLSRLKEAKWDKESFWILRTHFSYALSESVADTASRQEVFRTGLQVEGMYARQVTQQVDWGLGVRFDYETMTIRGPSVTIPTQRLWAVGELIYNFTPFNKAKQSLYIGVGLGVGISRTIIDETTVGGLTSIMPL